VGVWRWGGLPEHTPQQQHYIFPEFLDLYVQLKTFHDMIVIKTLIKSSNMTFFVKAVYHLWIFSSQQWYGLWSHLLWTLHWCTFDYHTLITMTKNGHRMTYHENETTIVKPSLVIIPLYRYLVHVFVLFGRKITMISYQHVD
jgi:hypothetical protein